MSKTSKQKSLKPTFKSILSKKQTEEVQVTYEGEDVTPETLNPLLNEGCKLKEVGKTAIAKLVIDKSLKSGLDVGLFTQTTSRFHTELHKQQMYAETIFRQSYNASFVDDVVIAPEHKITITSSDHDEKQEETVIESSEVYAVVIKMPSHISLLLKETNTFFILDLPSKTTERDSEEGKLVETENARYEYLTEGKGRNRKLVNAEVQTVQILFKSRYTDAVKITCKHQKSFASEWDMHDSYSVPTPTIFDSKRSSNLYEKVEDNDNDEISKEDLQICKLLKNIQFQQALCITERLLANNNFNAEQKIFRGLCDPDPFREDIEFKYRLRLLWTFANNDTKGKCVTALCWNNENSDILAVGYGKFFYTDRTSGMVMVWNIKNPVQPERCFTFEQPVTTINFSQNDPNLLAVGFYDGTIQIVDVSFKKLTVIRHSGEDSPSFEPIWQIIWYKGSDYFKDTEQIVTACQDGRIGFYRHQDNLELIFQQIMRVNKPEGKLKGIEILRRCHLPGIHVNRYAAALVIRQHPVDGNTYYVGTNEGTIHKCSRNYFHQHLDLFLAHYGPLYEIKFSPFCNKIFLTCGDDWHIRVWADGITQPLFELRKDMQSVQSVDWSPTHSTIIANVCGSNIYIWDIQRKVYKPQSVTQNPLSFKNTIIRFARSGTCLVVGDVEGNIHIFTLVDMPFAAYFSDTLLINSIMQRLKTSPDLIKELNKLGGLNFKKEDFNKDVF